MRARSITAVCALACAASACAPVLDWREVRPEGAGLMALFPCKPAGHTRRLPLAGVPVEMSLLACSAGGATYAVGFADVGQPQLVAAALDELVRAAARNIGSRDTPTAAPLRIEGMTPNPYAGHRAYVGQLADGRRVELQLAVFARGTRVFQATIVGAKLDAEAAASFFSALRLPA